MLESFPVAMAVGAVLGFLSGLGIGGGSLLIIWLTLGLGFEQAAARSINLLFFLPSAIASLCFRWKQGAVKRDTVLPAMLAGSLGAAVFSFIGMQLELGVLKKLFGGLLLATGLRELFYKPRKTQ